MWAVIHLSTSLVPALFVLSHLVIVTLNLGKTAQTDLGPGYQNPRVDYRTITIK